MLDTANTNDLADAIPADALPPISFDFQKASTPVSERARQIAAEARSLIESDKGGIKHLMVGRQDMFRINPFDLNVKPGWNSRDMEDPENVDHVMALAHSIAEHGVKEPLTAYLDDGKLWLSDGHCRLFATLYAIEHLGATIRTVPVKTEERGTDEADRLFSQRIRNSGKKFSPLEEGVLFKKLLAHGWTEEMIAKKTGLSAARVGQLLEMQGAPAEVKRLITTGKVSFTLALQMLRTNGGDGTRTLADLNGALKTAEAAGKDRATAKHVERNKSPMRSGGVKGREVKAIFNSDVVKVATKSEGGAVVRVITMPQDTYAKLMAALGMDA